MLSSVRAPSRRRHAPPDRGASSLRAEIAKWFDAESSARVTRFGRIYLGGSRYVCVSAPDRVRGGSHSLYFFHHGKSDWRVYPPAGVGPSIVYCSIAAPTASATGTTGATDAKAAPG